MAEGTRVRVPQSDGDSSRYCTGGREEDAGAAREYPGGTDVLCSALEKAVAGPQGHVGCRASFAAPRTAGSITSSHWCSVARVGPAPHLAAPGTNLSCGTVGIVPAAQGVRGNSSDLCPRALLGIPAEQGLWHFIDCNELLLLHWRQKHQPAVPYYHLLLVLHSTKGCYNSNSG